MNNIPIKVKCPHCSAKFFPRQMEEHIYRCKLNKPFECELCGQCFVTDKGKSNHKTNYHTAAEEEQGISSAIMDDWQGGNGAVRDRLKHLLESGEKSDVEFIVGKELWDEKSQKWIPEEEPELFKAHKFVLSISSQVFDRQFLHENVMPIKVIDITVSAFKAMLAFLYTDDLSLIVSDNFLDVYCAAKKYCLDAFVKKCHELAPQMLNRDNFIANWKAAQLHEDKILAEHCLKFIDENIRYFGLRPFSQAECAELLTRDTLQICWETSLFDYLKEWAKVQCKNAGIYMPNGEQLRAKMGNLISAIRFPLISPDIFLNEIVPTGILNAQEIAAMFVHYSESANDNVKQSFPLPFSAQPRTIRPYRKVDKLVSKNHGEKEKARLLAEIERLKKSQCKKRGSSCSAIGDESTRKNARNEH